MGKTKYYPHTENEFEYDEILPCPFCGKHARITFKGNSYTKSRTVEIKCTVCRANMLNATIRHDSEWIAKITIDSWNQRIK